MRTTPLVKNNMSTIPNAFDVQMERIYRHLPNFNPNGKKYGHQPFKNAML